MPRSAFGHFNSREAYIIQYTYNKVKGGKDLFILYFWQGRDSKKKDQGIVALQTIEVNKDISSQSEGYGEVEHQIRVVQSKEPDEFMNLFRNHYVIHTTNVSGVRLYDIRDGVPVECQRKYIHISQYACHALDDGN